MFETDSERAYSRPCGQQRPRSCRVASRRRRQSRSALAQRAASARLRHGVEKPPPAGWDRVNDASPLDRLSLEVRRRPNRRRAEPPALELADVFLRHGDAYPRDYAAHLGRSERRVMGAITACRTATFGGHVEQCDARRRSRVLRRATPPNWRCPVGASLFAKIRICLPLPRMNWERVALQWSAPTACQARRSAPCWPSRPEQVLTSGTMGIYWPGVRIGNHVMRQCAAKPWRSGAAEYTTSVQSGACASHTLEGLAVASSDCLMGRNVDVGHGNLSTGYSRRGHCSFAIARP